MNDLLAKISSYNIFNYLLPGAVFVAISQPWTGYSFDQTNLVVAAFVYYFMGMVISRIGSLVVEPIAKKSSFVKFSAYSDFVKASQKDTKLETLSEANNTYRTLCGLFLAVIALKLYSLGEQAIPALIVWRVYILTVFLLVLFAASYKKQTRYVFERVRANI